MMNNFKASGRPEPQIIWFFNNLPVRQSDHMRVLNDGTELRLNNIQQKHVGQYTCLARNKEGRIHHNSRIKIKGIYLKHNWEIYKMFQVMLQIRC